MGGWVRLKSPVDIRYKVLISPLSLEKNGAPCDPWGNVMVPVEKKAVATSDRQEHLPFSKEEHHHERKEIDEERTEKNQES